MYFSIIIPVYNEEKRIATTLLEIDNYLKGKSFEYEIIVVNDGSTDKTVGVIRELQPTLAHLRFIDNQTNKGKGFAVRQGLLEAQGQYRLFADADNSTPINQLEKFLPYAGNIDILIGSRSSKESKIVNPQPFYRIILGKLYGLFVKTIIGLWNFHDTQCGFKLFNKKSVLDVIPRCKTNGLSFDSEILIISQKLGYKIKEIPVTWANDKETKVTLKRMMGALLDVINIRWNLWMNTYYLE